MDKKLQAKESRQQTWCRPYRRTDRNIGKHKRGEQRKESDAAVPLSGFQDQRNTVISPTQ